MFLSKLLFFYVTVTGFTPLPTGLVKCFSLRQLGKLKFQNGHRMYRGTRIVELPASSVPPCFNQCAWFTFGEIVIRKLPVQRVEFCVKKRRTTGASFLHSQLNVR